MNVFVEWAGERGQCPLPENGVRGVLAEHPMQPKACNWRLASHWGDSTRRHAAPKRTVCIDAVARSNTRELEPAWPGQPMFWQATGDNGAGQGGNKLWRARGPCGTPKSTCLIKFAGAAAYKQCTQGIRTKPKQKQTSEQQQQRWKKNRAQIIWATNTHSAPRL